MAKKPRKSKLVPKGMPSGMFGGHRDLAELMSADYGLTLPKVGWDTLDQMFDMDQLTAVLEQMDGDILDQTAKDRWAQGFMMGMLHQLFLTQVVAAELDEDGDDES